MLQLYPTHMVRIRIHSKHKQTILFMLSRIVLYGAIQPRSCEIDRHEKGANVYIARMIASAS